MRQYRSIIAGLAILACSVFQQAEAQVYSAGANTTITGGSEIYETAYDTLEASESINDTFKVTEFRNSVLFQIHADKVSGNLGGSITLEGSASKSVPFVPITTWNLADADKPYGHVITGNPYTYYRLSIADTSATHVARYKRYIEVR